MSPSVLLDENLSPKIVNFLRKQDIDAKHVRDVGLLGKGDREIYRWAKQSGCIIVTRDLDFGRLFVSDTNAGGGIILLRDLPNRTNPFLAVFGRLIDIGLFEIEDLQNSLVVATPDSFRIRRRKPLH